MKDIDHEAHNARKNATGSQYLVSCLAPAKLPDSTISFVTGGHDKSVKLWKVDSAGSASSERIGAIGGSAPSAVAFRQDTVIVGTGKSLLTLDLNHPAKVPKPNMFSNKINHIHVHPTYPYITVLEVRSSPLVFHIPCTLILR